MRSEFTEIRRKNYSLRTKGGGRYGGRRQFPAYSKMNRQEKISRSCARDTQKAPWDFGGLHRKIPPVAGSGA